MLSLWRAKACRRRAGLLSESGQFAWKEFWRLSHVCPEFVPDDCAAAFEIYHFFGMCGHSEAAAESVAGTLKVFGKNENSTTGRIVEKTKLLRARVCGGPGETPLVHVAWATYFASNTVPKRVFWFRSSVKRRKAYPLGSGSKPIHSFQHQVLSKPRFTKSKVEEFQRLRTVLGCKRVRDQRWLKTFRKKRQSYDTS